MNLLPDWNILIPVSIILDNKDITRQRIQDRKVGIVFQDYAVFPHMTVFGNIAYPLRVRKEDKKSIAAKG